MVGWYPLLRVLSVITAFMNGNTPNRRRIRGQHSWIGEGITEVQVGTRSERGRLDTRFSFFETLSSVDSFVMKALKLLFTPSLIGRYNASMSNLFRIFARSLGINLVSRNERFNTVEITKVTAREH